MIVRESLVSFTKDGSPFRKLRVGQTVANDKVKYQEKWGYADEFVEDCDVAEYKAYRGYFILVLYYRDQSTSLEMLQNGRYIGCFDSGWRTSWCGSAEEALEKTKKHIDLRWPILKEAQGFTREGPADIDRLGVGSSAVFPVLLKELMYDSIRDKLTLKDNLPQKVNDISEKNIYLIDTRKFIYEYGNTPKNSVQYELMTKIMDQVIKMNPNKLDHNASGWARVFFTFNRMDEIWNAPKTWISERTWSELRQMDEATLIEKSKEQLTVNRCMVLSTEYGSPELQKWALQNGCTNANTRSNEAIQQACRRGQVELVKLLLTHPEVDPADTTVDGKRYKNDEHQYCIRQAAKEGFPMVVELLMKDKRVDPSYRNNWALAQALAGHHIEVCKLLVRDQRVRMKIDFMRPIDQNRFADLRRSGQL